MATTQTANQMTTEIMNQLDEWKVHNFRLTYILRLIYFHFQADQQNATKDLVTKIRILEVSTRHYLMRIYASMWYFSLHYGSKRMQKLMYVGQFCKVL